jgi:hypothetical protein
MSTVIAAWSSLIHPRFCQVRSCLLVLSRDTPTIRLSSRWLMTTLTGPSPHSAALASLRTARARRTGRRK